ncbi:TonB-dependent receptor [Nitrogeniibacter aestuarii]|uniref:TonB-dependent receptor n=1 Tax=Nitrogeniibacter aestuarii TaxID=2815343 RepID=UPI001D0F8A41|nr:TonB-dependent receptor [Nitrogeniibacter aestuarii]
MQVFRLAPITAALLGTALPCHAQTLVQLDEVSVTATREARATADVPQAISVIGRSALAQKKMYNLKEALEEIPGVLVDSKNGGFDARLIIRGAGLKAPYGIREIMVLRDGVPLTDPDSFTRLDFVDTQDIERIEVAKGPGNLFAAGSAGGAIQVISKSVFDDSANSARIGLGTQDTENYHLRYGGMISDTQALALTVSHRNQDNDWRHWNSFTTTQTSIKHGWMLSGDDTLESELSYAEADMQLPGSMDETLFNAYLHDGRQRDTDDPWKHSGRYSKVWFFNTRLEMVRGDFSFKPRFYYNTWHHYHPVTGLINAPSSWVSNIGTDLEGHWRHTDGTLVAGVSIRREKAPDQKKYEYRDVRTLPSGRILATLSDARGDLASTSDSESLLTGLYVQESWRPGERWIVDTGLRYDVIEMENTTDEITQYSWALGRYVAGDGYEHTKKTFRLPAPKLAVTYKLGGGINLFGMIAQAAQVPSSGEVSSNPSLDASVSRNIEFGLKGRHRDWSFDASVYHTTVRDEIVQINTGGVTEYANAGRTDKKGMELSGSVNLGHGVSLGGFYAWSDYTYDAFSEPLRVGFTTVNEDRAGKRLPFIPRHQYGAHMAWTTGAWKLRLAGLSWGEYWMDNANTQKYQGWDWVLNLSASYQQGPHVMSVNVGNLTDKRYAVEAKKDTSGNLSYTAAAPRSVMLTYRYDFN